MNRTCQHDMGDSLCGRKAVFHYTGIDLREKEKGQLTTDLCEDHGRDLADRVVPALDAGIVTIVAISSDKWTLMCLHCYQTCRIDRSGVNMVEKIAYCPMCGAKIVARRDIDRDYWEILSASLNNMTIELLRLLHSEWEDKRRFPYFRDYVKWALENV